MKERKIMLEIDVQMLTWNAQLNIHANKEINLIPIDARPRDGEPSGPSFHHPPWRRSRMHGARWRPLSNDGVHV